MGEFGGRTFQEGETAGAKTLRWRHGDRCRGSERVRSMTRRVSGQDVGDIKEERFCRAWKASGRTLASEENGESL